MRAGAALATAGLLVGCGRPASRPAGAPDPALEACGSPADSAAQATGAVAHVCGDDLQGIPATGIEELLQGRVAGAWVVATPGGFAIRIRGRASMYGDNDPLYVVDGMPVRVPPGQGITWLNPADILRIEILKDAGATAVYGVRGANGVVLITTRRAVREPESR
jgi:TonB-dependent SusC/RagA subfamily outer membrane receptor